MSLLVDQIPHHHQASKMCLAHVTAINAPPREATRLPPRTTALSFDQGSSPSTSTSAAASSIGGHKTSLSFSGVSPSSSQSRSSAKSPTSSLLRGATAATSLSSRIRELEGKLSRRAGSINNLEREKAELQSTVQTLRKSLELQARSTEQKLQSIQDKYTTMRSIYESLAKKYVRTAGDLEKLRAETVAMSDPQGSLVRTRSLRKSHGASPLFFQGSSNESPNSMMENPLLHGSHMSASGGGAAFVAESTAPSISTTTRLNFHPFSPSLDEGSTTISSPAGTAASPRRPGLSKQDFRSGNLRLENPFQDDDQRVGSFSFHSMMFEAGSLDIEEERIRSVNRGARSLLEEEEEEEAEESHKDADGGSKMAEFHGDHLQRFLRSSPVVAPDAFELQNLSGGGESLTTLSGVGEELLPQGQNLGSKPEKSSHSPAKVIDEAEQPLPIPPSPVLSRNSSQQNLNPKR